VYFAKEVRVLTVIHGTAAALTVGAAMILVPPLGVLGASFVLVIGSGATACALAAWNYVRRRDYVAVSYERGRLTRFGTAYVLFSIAALWTRTWPLSAEIAFAVALSVCLAIVLSLSLTPSERTTAREYGHRLVAAIRGAAQVDAPLS
jgi:O-antigen/teichoic acid export membrane protein